MNNRVAPHPDEIVDKAEEILPRIDRITGDVRIEIALLQKRIDEYHAAVDGDDLALVAELYDEILRRHIWLSWVLGGLVRTANELLRFIGIWDDEDDE